MTANLKSLSSLKTLKAELKRLSESGELKKEINRLAKEVRAFDLTTALSPERRARLEKSYESIRSTVIDVQNRIDTSIEKLAALVRKTKTASKPSKTTKRKAPRISVKKSVRKPAKAAAKKAPAKAKRARSN